MNKKGETGEEEGGEDLLFPEFIFITLTIAAILIVIGFVYTFATGAAVYEQAYAKQIALILDNAKPTMSIEIDLSKGMKIAEKDGRAISDIVKIDSSTNTVSVGLSKRGSYNYKYFSDYDVTSYFDGDNLIITVNEKGTENNAGVVENA